MSGKFTNAAGRKHSADDEDRISIHASRPYQEKTSGGEGHSEFDMEGSLTGGATVVGVRAVRPMGSVGRVGR